MPITPERQNIEELRAAGFTEAQALLLASKLEATAQSVSEDLKGFIVAELDKRFAALHSEIDARFAQIDVKFAEFEARVERSLRIQLATILSAFVGVTMLAVAVIKLF
jgi:uncharacterized small protein (DUF1192 family)